MRLLGKKLLMMLSDGVEETEVDQLKKGFEEERAIVLLASPTGYPTIETVKEGRRGRDILVDLPWEEIEETAFDGLIIPDGFLSTDLLLKDERVLNVVFMFYQLRLPIFASGKAVELLYESHVLSRQIVVREGTPLGAFMDEAVRVLAECPPLAQAYRLTM